MMAGGVADERFLLKSRCGALLPDAQVNRTLNAVKNVGTWGLWGLEMAAVRKVFGGLWVGGDLYVSKEALLFAPNWLNRQVHEGDVSLSIPFAEVTEVRRRFGLVTGIVDVVSGSKRQSIRCYGATKLAADLEQCRHDWRDATDGAKSLRT